MLMGLKSIMIEFLIQTLAFLHSFAGLKAQPTIAKSPTYAG